MGTDEFGSPFNIDRLSFYRGRYGEMETIDIKSLDQSKIEQAINELRQLWELKFY